MITFFSIPRPFDAEFGPLQRQAIRSWQGAVPNAQIILFGDEDGMRHAVRELGVTQCLELDVDKGSPRTARMFDAAERYSAHEWMLYTSCDLIIGGQLQTVLSQLEDIARPFVIGRRWDIEPGATHESATLHAACGVDYFLYRKGQIGRVPNFHVRGGRGDNWFVWKALAPQPLGWNMTVIDASEAITAIHVNHRHPAWPTGKAGREGSREQRENVTICRLEGMYTIPGVDAAPYVLAGGRVTERGKQWTPYAN